MADKAEQWDEERTLVGVRMLNNVRPLLARLRGDACQRDRAGNRKLFYDDLCALLLLSFFNPTVKSLGDLRRSSRLKQVKKKLGVRETSLGSLSESLRLFDPELLAGIVQELFEELPDSPHVDARLKGLAHAPTAVDGSLLNRLPQLAQASLAGKPVAGWKLHAQFEVLRGAPTFARVSDAGGKGEAGEKAVIKTALQPGRCYITDRGYEDFSLFNQIHAVGSSYVCRVRNDHALYEPEPQELSEEARAAGVLSDVVGRMGSPKSRRIECPDHPQRHVTVKYVEHVNRSGRRRTAVGHDIVLATNLLDVPPEVIALLYRYRWLIELFFRWLKCVMGCRHLFSRDADGVQIQMYCALIAFLLVQLACGADVKPNQWTFKLLCLYFQGLADEEEVLDHIRERQAAAQKDHA